MSNRLLHQLRTCVCLAIPLLSFAMEAGAPPTDGKMAQWRSVGWGGGSFYWAAAWHPTEEDVMYLGGDCTGAYRSADRGRTWTFANHGIADYAVFSLAVSPSAPDLVYMLTDGGLHKSVDRAKTWSFIADSAAGALDIRSKQHNSSTRAVAIDPRDAAVVYAGSHTGKLFKTVDGGASWSELPYLAALPKAAEPLAFSGSGALRLTYDGSAASGHPVGRMSRMFGPGDKAKDWSGFTKLAARVRVPEGAPALRAQLVVQTGDAWQWQAGAWTDCKPGAWSDVPLDLTSLSGTASVRMAHLAVSCFEPGWKGEVLVDAMTLSGADGKDGMTVADWEKSGDAEGWAANRQAKDSLQVTSVRQSQAQAATGCVTAVAVAPGDPATVYVTNKVNGIFRSDDGGANWSALDAPKQVFSIAVSATDAAIAWAACDGAGVFRTTDRGRTWRSMNGAGFGKGVKIHDLALHAAKPGLVYAIGNDPNTWRGYLFRSDDSGATWTRSNLVRNDLAGNPTNPEETGGGEFRKGFSALSLMSNVVVNPRNPDELFICGNWRNVFSADGGKTLEERVTGADNTCTTDVQFADGRTYVTAMDEGLVVSDDDGGTWRQMLPLKYDADISGHMWRVRVTGSGAATRIIATGSPWNAKPNANRVFVSEDAGKSFISSMSGLPDYVPTINCMWGRSYPRALAVDPQHPEVMYLGMDGDAESPARPGGGVFRSADGGKTWVRCAGQPGGRRMFYGLAVDPTESKRLFWSCGGTGGGAWRSEDEGASWRQVLTSEPFSFNLETSPSGAVFVAGGNLQRSTDHGTTWKPITKFTGGQAIVGLAIDPADERRIWISRLDWGTSSRGTIHRTTDGGATWQDITGDIPYRKPLVLRYNPRTRMLWAAGAGIFTLAQ